MLTDMMKDELVKGLLNLFHENLSMIILYGSVARNEATSESDIDIAIITKNDMNEEIRNKFICWSAEMDIRYDKIFSIIDIKEENMKKVAEVFKEKTGKDYQTAVVWKMTTKKKLTKTVHTYYNWLMGYGIDDNNIPEIVLIPVDPKWDWIDEPIYCKKTNSEMTQDKKTSLFILKNDQLEDGKIDLQLISSVAMMENYLMDVNYMFDYEKLSEYCMKYWMGK